jgi:hypothetical protein
VEVGNGQGQGKGHARTPYAKRPKERLTCYGVLCFNRLDEG